MRLDRLQPKREDSCRYRKRSIEINAVQICVLTAFADMPTKVLIFRFCSIA